MTLSKNKLGSKEDEIYSKVLIKRFGKGEEPVAKWTT
jgi:hypothetical protein